MDKYLEIIHEVIPSFRTEDFDLSFNDAGVESMDLVMLRVSFEKHFKKPVPAALWLNFTKMRQIIDFYSVSI
jgi:acyl carrier protein